MNTNIRLRDSIQSFFILLYMFQNFLYMNIYHFRYIFHAFTYGPTSAITEFIPWSTFFLSLVQPMQGAKPQKNSLLHFCQGGFCNIPPLKGREEKRKGRNNNKREQSTRSFTAFHACQRIKKKEKKNVRLSQQLHQYLIIVRIVVFWRMFKKVMKEEKQKENNGNGTGKIVGRKKSCLHK